MKAITVWQPWASLIAVGAKRYETRSWATSYRGPIAIHAAARKPDTIDIPGATAYRMIEKIRPLVESKAKTTMYLPLNLLPLGAIIATAELVACWEVLRSTPEYVVLEKFDESSNHYFMDVAGEELLFGDFSPGRFAWELADVKMLEEPVPAKGKQGLWNWEGEAL